LDDGVVALPTASATSVVLLKILLRLRWGVAPRFVWFDQVREDPFQTGADAALFIGDVALRPDLHPAVPLRFDLGAEWWNHTGLPFAFAVWQAAGTADAQLRPLHRTLLGSRSYGETHRAELAVRYAEHFGSAAPALERYWEQLVFQLDHAMIEGLRAFYRLATEIGALAAAPVLRWAE
jgi:chorismate dehydratase